MILPEIRIVNDPQTGTSLTHSVCPVCGILAATVVDWRLHSLFHGVA